MAQVYSNSLYPPDNSGDWYDDGWGGWMKDVSVIGKVPTGYYDDGWGVYVPIEDNSTLDGKTAKEVRNAITEAKTFGQTKVGRILSQILDFGLPKLKTLVELGVVKNLNAPLSLSNLDVDKINQIYDRGGFSATKTIDVPKPNPQNPNSTFLGIDFSNGLNVALLLLALVGLWKLISGSGSSEQTKPQPVAEPQRYSGFKRRRSIQA